MAREDLKSRKKPSYPSAARQWQGLALVALIVIGLEVYSQFVSKVKSPGGILLLSVIFVTYWSGLRQGLIAAVMSLAYLLYAYSTPGELFHYTPDNASRITTSLILYPLVSILVGVMDGRLRNAAVSEWEARERAEAEIERRIQSEDMQRFVNESAMDAVIAMDHNGHISLWNPSAERIFGWTSEEVVGKTLSETIIPHSLREAHERGFKRFLQTGEAAILGKRLELTGLRKDGQEFPIEISIAKRDTKQGSIFIGFARDITEQKKLNERLRQGQKMEAIGTLAGGIAHDFNNILMAISGNLMLAREDVPDGNPAQVSLTEIDKSVRRATYVVRQILTFSRSKESKTEPLNIASTLRESVALLRATIPSNLEIIESFDDDLPTVITDATDVHQMVLNLGINAQQALHGNAGRLEILASPVTLDAETASVTMGLAAGSYLRISFRDNGCGMDDGTRLRIFEPFFTTKEVGEGTGLGLAVVYGLVTRHGGAITVYSELNKGTVFHVYLPTSNQEVAPSEQPALEHRPGNGERILYIDDDDALVFMMDRMLGRLNYHVTGFVNPLEGLQAFKSSPDAFDLVITDMSMPQLSGPELVQQIQAIRPGIPIIMVTGYIRPMDLEQASSIGVRELVLKPNTVVEMSAVLHRVIADEKLKG